MESVPVYDRNGEEKGKIEFDQGLFDGKVRNDLLHQAVLMYRANARAGTASTLNRAMVSGGGVKPWRQKGTGRARAGSTRSPIWRKGGVTFGPTPRDYGFRIPRKARREALVSVLNGKLKDGEIVFVDDLKVEEPKTKNFVEILRKLPLKAAKKGKTGTVLVLTKAVDAPLLQSSRNVRGVTVKAVSESSVYDFLVSSEILMTVEAWEALLEKIKPRVEKQAKA